MPSGVFQGFTKDSPRFFKELGQNNNSAWFNANRPRYEAAIKRPAHALMEDLLVGLKKVLPEINQGKIMRINRDIRFSRDKSPYKTNVAMLLWNDKMSGPGASYLYFHFNANSIVLGDGVHEFENEHRSAFRRALVDPSKGPAFTRIVSKLKNYEFGGKFYKRVPKGFDPAHKNADFLLYKGLYASLEMPIPPEAFGPGLVAFCLARIKPLAPLHRWMCTV